MVVTRRGGWFIMMVFLGCVSSGAEEKRTVSDSSFVIEYSESFQASSKRETRLTQIPGSCVLERKNWDRAGLVSKSLSPESCQRFFKKHRELFESPPTVTDWQGPHERFGTLSVKYKGASWSSPARVISYELCDAQGKCKKPDVSPQSEAATDLVVPTF